MPGVPSHPQKSVFKWVEAKDAAHENSGSKSPTEGDGKLDNLVSEGGGFDNFTKKSHATISIDDVAQHYGVPQNDLFSYMEAEADKEESCQSMPFTLLLVLSYALMAITHDKAPYVNAVEDSIDFDITDNANFAWQGPYMGHKNIHDVNSHADFWSWMQTGFVPLMFQQYYALSEYAGEPYYAQASEVFQRKDRGVLMNYNRVILGIRMVQERAEVVDANGNAVGQCKYKPLDPLYDKECVGGQGSYELEPEVVAGRKTMVPKREHWLYIHDDIEFVRQQLVAMEKHGWLDANTLKVELSLPVHNAEYGLHALIMCNFFFSRGGHIWKAIIPLTTFTQTFKNWYNFAIDFTWLFCLLWIILQEGMEIGYVVKEHTWRGLWGHYVGFWNMVDWISVFAGLGILGMLYLNESYTKKMNDELITLGMLDEESQRSAYREQGKLYFNALEVECHYSYTFRMVMASYPMVIAMRLFKAFGSQPRLAIITNTLSCASTDLVHFLLIFMSVFITYTVASVVLFGREVHNFTTMFRACITCARLMWGDFDWETMRSVGRLDAFLWFLPFAVLIIWVLLNMLIAIVMDAYNDVKTALDGEDTIWQMLVKVYRQKRKELRGEIVPYKKVITRMQHAIAKKQEEFDDLESRPSDATLSRAMSRTSITQALGKAGGTLQMLDPSRRQQEEIGPITTMTELKSMFPGGELSTLQARDIIKGAITSYYNAHKEQAKIGEALVLANKINWSSKKLKDKVKARVNAKGLAKNNVGEVANLANECMSEMSAARQDLADWLPEDEDDCPLPEEWLVHRIDTEAPPTDESSRPGDQQASQRREARSARISTAAALQFGEPSGEAQPARHGLLTSVREMTNSKETKVQNLTPGSTAQLLADEHLVLSACRASGISPKYDVLRRMALGRVMKVLERDERDGTVLCKLDGVGTVWFPVAAFAPTMMNGESAGVLEPTGSDRSQHENERRVAELERELQVGKDTVSLGIQTLNELHARLEVIRNTKRRGIEKFQEKRREAVMLSRENRDRRTRWKEGQTRLNGLTQERDDYFERVRALVDENRQLQMKIEAGKVRAKMGNSHGHGRG